MLWMEVTQNVDYFYVLKMMAIKITSPHTALSVQQAKKRFSELVNYYQIVMIRRSEQACRSESRHTHTFILVLFNFHCMT